MENKGLRVNMKKTEILISGSGLDLLESLSKFPCAVCYSKGVGVNSIMCSACKLWVHKKCSGLSGRISADPLYVCPRCLGVACPIDGRPAKSVDVDGVRLDVDSTFCYLGDMLNSRGGFEHAIKACCCDAWGKFRKHLPILTSRHISLPVKGKFYSSYVRSAMLWW